MHERAARYRLPPVVRRDDGEIRRVGIELEFSGLDLDRAAEAVRAAMDAERGPETAAERVLSVAGLGDFVVEVDWDYLKRAAARTAESDASAAWVHRLSQAAAVVVPIEVAGPPLPMNELERLDPLVEALRAAGARGTEESLIAAYGVHINVELPRLDAATVNAYLTAFALLQWWLMEAHEVDRTRRISFYIELFDEDYVRQVLSRRAPEMDEIFADYLAHNASRNRALDVLPLLAEIDEDRVRRAVDDPKIKARPALHYRLPNCHIEQPGWTPADAWNLWLVVERLAGRPQDLAELRTAFLDAARPMLGVSRHDWVERLDRWLSDRGLA